ncbi:MAG TPA: SDR family NAD(P)-dependent oxidoreductase, partial [Blastocatellia bacterium]|nr:SDR family NAD(P)-dependent oxidoreductase [Blastocatellia bacterium]
EVFKAVENGSLKPLPVRVFQTGTFEDAFRFMAQANHIGKIVVSMRERNVLIESPADSAPLFREDGSYLITGGLGALGLTVARWMVERGARHLILMGRNAPAETAKETVASLKESGVKVVTAKVDVASLRQVKQAVARSKEKMPPLRGVIHAAGILDDGILLQQNIERFRKVMAPKCAGAWNLHIATSEDPLDFFILFSSVASLLGSPGQGNYSAANSFLDSLAHYRRGLGLPAMSINWGPWSEIGLAARPDRGERLALRGVGSMAPERAIDALQKLFAERPTQVAVMPFDLEQWRLFNPAADGASLLAGVSSETEGTAAQATSRAAGRTRAKRDALLAAEPQERQALLETYLREQVARVLGLSPANLDAHQPLNRFGLDSLMAVEVKNRIELDIGAHIPVVRLLQGPSLAHIADQLAGQLTAVGGDPSIQRTPGPVAKAPQPTSPSEDLTTRIDQMSDEEVESLLKSMMMEEIGGVE